MAGVGVSLLGAKSTRDLLFKTLCMVKDCFNGLMDVFSSGCSPLEGKMARELICGQTDKPLWVNSKTMNVMARASFTIRMARGYMEYGRKAKRMGR